MNKTYVAEVHRFGGRYPYVDQNGRRRNLRHTTDFSADEVKTDGFGNVKSMPLLAKKPCFGRPERLFRAVVGSKPWTDQSGVRQPGDTPCDTCFKLSPSVFESCLNRVDPQRWAALGMR